MDKQVNLLSAAALGSGEKFTKVAEEIRSKVMKANHVMFVSRLPS